MPKKTERKRVVLIDSHALIHRAYHAIPANFTSASGAPTNALYGLVTMMLRIIADLRPDQIIACFDLPKPTMRHEAYEGYKGTRTKIDDALISQIEASRKVFEAFSIPLYEREGFEADDLLGTIAHKLREAPDTDVVIASGDMDMLQLVEGTRVQVFTLKKGINDTILYDEKGVKARFGFPPTLLPDWKGLRGDPSDNIKGVPGIGEKTATDIITNFGSIEEIYKALEKGGDAFLKKGIKARMVGLLREHEEDARFSKSLATIRLDAPIAFSLPGKEWCERVDLDTVLALFDEFGFRSLRARARTTLLNAGGRAEKSLEDFIEESEALAEAVPPQRLREAGVMLWLISSEFTKPTLDDILAFTKQTTFDLAYTELEKQLATLGRVQSVYEEIEKPLIPLLEKMEERGVLVDPSVLTRLAKEYHADLDKIEKNIYTLAGREFNVSSPKQLGEILFDELKIIPDKQKKTAGGQRSTKESELEKIQDAHPIVANILEYRELKKLLSTYIDNLPPLLDTENRLHAQFLQTGTTTGRMSSQNPNLQNIPLRSERGQMIRHAFVASKGFTLVSLDYSQVELRIAAILSGDETLCAIFRSGRDVHTEVASRVFAVAPEAVDTEMRRRAKIINFGILYGMGVNALRSQLGSTTAEAHQFLNNYFTTFKTLSEYLETTKGFARKHGYTETLFGRRRQFPEMKSVLPYVRAQAERMAINAPIQGTQSDIIKLAMSRADAQIEKGSAYLLLQVHDELVYEIRTEKEKEIREKIKKIMESVLSPEQTNGVPILVTTKTGPDWGSLQKV